MYDSQLTGVEAGDGLELALGGVSRRGHGRNGTTSFARHC